MRICLAFSGNTLPKVVSLLQKPFCVKQPVDQDWMPQHCRALQFTDLGVYLSILIQLGLTRIQFRMNAACDELSFPEVTSSECLSQWNDDCWLIFTEEMVGRRLFVTYSPNCHQFPVQGRLIDTNCVWLRWEVVGTWIDEWYWMMMNAFVHTSSGKGSCM